MMTLTVEHLAALTIAACGADTVPALAQMREAGMIEPLYKDESEFTGWQLTEKGRTWINAALALPIPQQQWVIS